MDEVHYTLTRDDFWHLQLYAFSRQRLRIILFNSLVFVGSFILLDYLFSGDYSFSILKVVFSLCSAPLMTLFIFSLFYLRMWLATSRSHEVLEKSGVNVLAISEQGTQLRNEISNGTSSWQAYKAIEEDKRNIYFVLDQPGRVFTARLIPKRAFESSSQAGRFMARAQGYWQEQTREVATSHS